MGKVMKKYHSIGLKKIRRKVINVKKNQKTIKLIKGKNCQNIMKTKNMSSMSLIQNLNLKRKKLS
jgi:hypothetical protein